MARSRQLRGVAFSLDSASCAGPAFASVGAEMNLMPSTQIDVKDYSYFAGNQWRPAQDNHLFEVHEPYSGKLFARVAAGSRADARVAVDAASKAFTGWAETGRG